MLVPPCRHVDRDGSPWRNPLPLVAQHEAPPDVEIPVEPEPLVEWPARGGIGASECHQVALDGVDVAGGRFGEGAQVVRHDAPPARDRDAVVVERPSQRRDDIACRLDARVHEDHHRPARPPQPDVQRRAVAQPLARPDDLGASGVRPHCGLVQRVVGDDDDRRPIR